MLNNLEMLVRPAEHTDAQRNLILQRRNAELKKFGTGRRVPLRRSRGGGQLARSSLNVIGWRHTVEYGLLKLASIFSVIFETMI